MFPLQTHSQKMNQLRVSRGRTRKSSASPGGTQTIVWNICSYQVPSMVGTNSSTNENHKFYNSMVQDISSGGGGCATKVVSLCYCFVGMVAPVKTQVVNEIIKIFYLQGQTTDVSDQGIFIFKGFGYSWWRRKENQCKQPAYSRPEAIMSFFHSR